MNDARARPPSASAAPARSDVVLFLVGQELPLVVKGLATNGAAEGAVPDVALAVGDEVGLLAKAAVAVRAGVGALADISRGWRSSMPQPMTRPDSPVPSLLGPCDRSLKSEVPCGSCLNWR